MRINSVPVTSVEVRWFLEGSVAQQDRLRRWFETVRPWRAQADTGAAGQERQAGSGRLDVHLVIPRADDMGIRWRDGTLQVKGRVSALGPQGFCGGVQGNLERWVTWSYDDLSGFYRNVFASPPRGVVTVTVRKHRWVRKARLEPGMETAEEVRSGAFVHRGMSMELTDLEVNGMTFCSLGFKAFPDDGRPPHRFVREVNACLESLDHVRLAAANSLSYPAWLGTLTGCNARPVAQSSGPWRLTAGAVF